MGNKKTADKCNKCKRVIKGLPFKCGYCGKNNCSKHCLPENHNCKWLEGRNEKNFEDWKDKIRGVKKDYHRDDEYFGDDTFSAGEYLDPLEINPLKKSNQIKSSDSGGNGFLIFLVIIMAVVLFFLYYPIDTELIDNISPYTYRYDSISEDSFSSSLESHWDHMPLTYNIEDNCIERMEKLMLLAMEKINNETLEYVQFEEVNNNPDISFYCKEYMYDRSGEYSLADATNTNDPYNSNIITHLDINVYGQGSICGSGYPALEVHELLHGFGFNHNPMTKSIMSPYSAQSSKECKIDKIDKAYTDCLMYIYSNAIIGSCLESKLNYITSNNEYESVCSEGYYEAVGSDWCCQEPNMYVDDEGYCSY